MGGDRRRGVVRSRARGRHGVVRVGAGHVAGADVPRRSRADAGRRHVRGGPGAALEPVARPGALACWPRRILLTGDVDQAAALFAEASALGGHARPTPTALVVSEAELAVLAMDRGRWAEAAEHVEPALAAIDRAPDARLRHQRARLRRRRPARRAPRRPEGGEPSAHAGDASPPDADVRAAVPRRAGTAAAGQGVLGDRRPRRPLVTCCARSTTSCCTGRRSAPSSTRSSAFRELVTSDCADGSDRRVAAHSGRAAAAPVSADAPHVPRDRASGCSCPATRSAPRSARSIESWASRHAATRCNRRRRSACSARSRRSATGLVLQGVVDVVPERHRQLRGGGDDARAARRRGRRRPARRRSRRPSLPHSPRHRPAAP